MKEREKPGESDLWLVPESGNFQEFLGLYLERAENFIPKFISGRRILLPFSSPFIDKTYEEAEKLISGGKKLRGALVALGFSVAGGERKLEDAVIGASVGYEFLHNAFLVHDDIQDRATLRRGQPVAWRNFAQMVPQDSEHYGISQGISLGDMIAFWGPLLFSDRRIPGNRVREATAILSQVVETTVIGQILDLAPYRNIDEISRDELLTIACNKTAVYSFIAPLQIGAVLGGTRNNSPLLSAIERFGTPLGIAFQIQDDILGVCSTEEELGKSVFSDLAEAKKTLLFSELYKRLREDEKQYFLTLWGGRNVGMTGLDWVRKRARETGALAIVGEFTQTLIEEARIAIPNISQDSRVQRIFTQLADFVTQREY